MEKTAVVVLAAGRGTRFIPLTDTTPKPMIKILGKPILAHTLTNIADQASEFIIIVGHKKEVFKEYFGDSYEGVSVTYVEQNEQLGTAHAIELVKDKLTSNFYLLYGDDLYEKQLFELLKDKKNAAVGMKEKNWQNFGILQEKDGKLQKIVEKPSEFIGDLAAVGVYKFESSMVQFLEKGEKSDRGEHEFPDILNKFAAENEVEVISVDDGWIPLSYPWQLLEAVKVLLSIPSTDQKGTIEPGAVVKGNVVIGEGTVIKSGAYIEGNVYIGAKCTIGPNCFIREFTSIGDSCFIGNAVEICRSIVGDNTFIKHLTYIGDSIIGNDVNIAAGTAVANLKHNKEHIKVKINGKITDTGLLKFGTIIGDGAKTGINTSIYPGRKIGTGAMTLPGEIVKEDKV